MNGFFSTLLEVRSGPFIVCDPSSLGRWDVVELGGIVPHDFSLAFRGHPRQRQQLFYGMTISPSLRMAEVCGRDQIVIAQYLDDLFDPRVVLVRGDVTLTLE